MIAVAVPRPFLVPEEPLRSLDDYIDIGGGAAVVRAEEQGAAATLDQVRASGLRGRGGAGFPTGVKWAGIHDTDATFKYVVCNAAEGEPGTFKDRWLMRTNPYQLMEGIAIASFSVGATAAFIGVKERFEPEIAALERAASEMSAAGILTGPPITIVPGPDDYLFGEEKALLEVIEGRDPLPRLYPPYVQGLFEEPGGEQRPALVNNVETLSNVPHIVRNGPDWFRSIGTERTPGTMVFTIGGDVRTEAVAELPMGTPLSVLVYGVGGGLEAGRRIAMIANGVSNRALDATMIDTPLDFDSMRAAGSGLGSGGFTVYDDTACVVQVAGALSEFLFRGSCGQCPPCKLGTEAIADRLEHLGADGGGPADLEEIAAWTLRVTDANRCGLGAGQREVAGGLLDRFDEHLALHVDGEPCASNRVISAPVIEEWTPAKGRFRYR